MSLEPMELFLCTSISMMIEGVKPIQYGRPIISVSDTKVDSTSR